MYLYELKSGPLTYYVAASDENDAREQGEDAERFPDIHFLPFEVKKVTAEGITITATYDAPTGESSAPRRGRRTVNG